MQRLRTRRRASASRGAPAALSLDFLSASGALDPRITFSRGSNATLTDSTGRLTYAPTNLLTNSEQFDNAAWTKLAATVTANVATAPDGTSTADKAIATATASTTRGVYGSVTLAAVTHVVSVYAKAAEYSLFRIAEAQGGRFAVSFDLSNGTVVSGTSGGTQFISASISSAGNGWYRCSVVFTGTAVLYSPSFIGYPAGASLGNFGAAYAGDGTSGVLIWGADLEPVTYQTTPGTYNSTTPKNLLGYSQEFDNAAWTKSNAFVQTNLLLQSQAFDAANWTPVSGSISANTATAPDGTLTADTVNLSGSGSYLLQNVSISTGVAYTISFYIRTISGSANIRLVTDGGISTSADIPVGSTWQRVTYTATSSRTASVGHGIQGQSAGGATSFYIWGAQLVQGSTAGDYQRTDAAAAAVQYTAPDGTLSAKKVVENTASARHGVNQGVSVLAGTLVASVYAKKGENDFLAFAPGGSGQPNTFTWFNLATGAIATNNNTSASITSMGNGWYRCSITFTAIAGTIVPLIETSKTNGSNVYTGDGTSGIYIWGAQLSDSASLDPYVYNPVAAPTAAAYYGPRFDYDPVTLAPKGLLIEEQRTNLLTYSAQFDDAAWLKGVGYNSTITANSTTAPDGTVTADTLLADNAGGTGSVILARGFSATSGTTYTFSFFAKRNTLSWISLYLLNFTSPVNGGAFFDLSSGSIGTVDAGRTATITNFGNGWYRCAITFTAGATVSGELRVYLASANNNTTVNRNGTDSVFLYGAQLEAGSFATSYIPTVASQVTRSADVATMIGDNFKSWYNLNAGTFTADFDVLTVASTTGQNIYSLYTSGANLMRLWIWEGAPTIGRFTVINGTTQAELTSGALTANTLVKASNAYQVDNFAASYNGGTVLTDTSGTVPVGFTQLNIGSQTGSIGFMNGHIRSLGYYNTRQPNATLQTLTNPSTTPSLALNFISDTYTVGA